MAFDAAKDVTLREWTIGDKGLHVRVARYNGGEAKFQIGPRMSTKEGVDHYEKAGRLSAKELADLEAIIPEAMDLMVK
jgi:hypothetical protein